MSGQNSGLRYFDLHSRGYRIRKMESLYLAILDCFVPYPVSHAYPVTYLRQVKYTKLLAWNPNSREVVEGISITGLPIETKTKTLLLTKQPENFTKLGKLTGLRTFE